MRAVLNDIKGAPVGADHTLSKGFGHGYTRFSGAWSEVITDMGRADGFGVRRMVSVLRRKLLCTPGRSPGFEAAPIAVPSLLLPRLEGPSGCLETHLRLQWRDRTGIAPDFPFQPLRAPWV
jgi:hypothetical protein